MRLKYFSSPDCRACHEKRPLVQQTARDLGIDLQEFDVATDDLALVQCREYGFNSIPAVVIEANETVLYRGVGNLINRESIERVVAAHRSS